ncbi:hypothetical protein AMAG_11231 [Allomyces macrogynus ATCC 38327]|uniref:Coiled-coil domain-containing protein 58 n=1 Tax=Allomyces macrogynus (strain ATCC 38327) TaxID=578462 RepID=A0A0L0SWL2_ALLM3|nr:hypothetical protein AMAG_11231 [Allomyces macrogynus ATCC 38327]|eukprot:KNE66734.1 hypothetical protein AMAG_11231 [Allomyces macrogynus ATCC 38327]
MNMPFDPSVCLDFSYFKGMSTCKHVIKELRRVDDNLNIRLNRLPRHGDLTAPCADFRDQLLAVYQRRAEWIVRCSEVIHYELDTARTAAATDPTNLHLSNKVKELERKHRLLANESTVESILRDRTATALKRKCHITLPTA